MDEKYKILETIKIFMSEVLDESQMSKLSNTLISVLKDYDVTRKNTELAIYDDSNEKLLKFFTGMLKMQSKSEKQ